MKKKIFILIIIVCIPGLLLSQVEFNTFDNTNCCKGENCGFVQGKIYDHDTGKQVEEIFYVAISKCEGEEWMDGALIINAIHTNNKGEFSFIIDIGEYCLIFFPKSKFSKYHGDPFVARNPEAAIRIQVKKGTTSYVKKMVQLGGRIKLNFVDLNGESVDLKTILPPKADIDLTIRSEKITPYYQFEHSISDFLICRSVDNAAYNLAPGVYQGIVNYKTGFGDKNAIGFGSQLIPDILVEPGETTELDIVFDKNHRTGISGVVRDENGKLLKGVTIKVYSETSAADGISYPHFQIRAKDRTNIKGEFKIVGLDEFYNPYKIHLALKKSDGKYAQKKILNIILVKDTIIFKSYVLPISNN